MTLAMHSTPGSREAAPCGVVVRLSLDELTLAANMGVQRAVAMITRRQGRGRVEQRGDVWESNVVGMLGEYAVAKLLGVAYSPSLSVPDRVAGDVAGLQVRSTRHAAGHLVLHPSDPDGEYVLVCVDSWRGECCVAGWITRSIGVQVGIDAPRGGAGDVWVAQEMLAPWEMLAG